MKLINLYFLLLLSILLSSSLICTTLPGTSDLDRIGPSSSSISPREKSAWNPTIAEIIGKMNETRIYNSIDRLQSIPTRRYGTEGSLEAASYLCDELSDIPGLRVEYDSGSILKNIIATLPGIDNSSEGIVMVGAHYDSEGECPGLADTCRALDCHDSYCIEAAMGECSAPSDTCRAPGATDNACGVAIVLELARIMSQYQFNHTIAFALWSGEEDGIGSRQYVNSMAHNSVNIPLYFNFDSACYDPEDRFILDVMYNNQSIWAKEMITQDNTLYGINFTLTYNVHTCGSDHKPFWGNYYPAVMTHSQTHGPAHSESDTIDKVSSKYALKNGQLGMIVLAQVAEIQKSSTGDLPVSKISNKSTSSLVN
jgi:hypothetical protein